MYKVIAQQSTLVGESFIVIGGEYYAEDVQGEEEVMVMVFLENGSEVITKQKFHTLFKWEYQDKVDEDFEKFWKKINQF